MSPSGAGSRRELWLSWAKHADTRVFCYANAELRKGQKDDEIPVLPSPTGKQRTGRLPEELIFDSKLTTYATSTSSNPGWGSGVFITLRRRSKKLVEEIARAPESAWRRIELKRAFSASIRRHAFWIARLVTLKDYDQALLRQLSITDLGHGGTHLAVDEPVEPFSMPPHSPLRAKRMLIEKSTSRTR